jgi:hypothetical protein
LITWVGGILATVISGVLVYRLTPPPNNTVVQVEGRVIDIATNSLIKDARVTLRAGPYSQSQMTDTEGRYGFDVPLPETTEGNLVIEATGYHRYSVNRTLKKLSETEDNKLLHELVLPSIIQEQEAGLTGTWSRSGQGFSATWNNGAVANLEVRSFTPASIRIVRTDTSDSGSAGLTAVYTGQISDAGNTVVNGSVTWTWPGHPGFPATGTWTASW